MKSNTKVLFALISTFVISFTSCTDLDTTPLGGELTSDQKKDIAELLPSRLAADITGMYASIGKQECVFPGRSRDDDFGYPAVCLSQDLNGPDMVSDVSNYNWFSVSSSYEDRNDTYANPYARWAVFYNQIKLANDILASIPEDTENPVLKAYMGQALAVRAFDYLGLVPYFQFKYKGNEEKPSVPIVTHQMSGDLSKNPRATQRKVYELIMSDLNKAIELLEGFVRTSKGEIDQSVAYGLRARANLYMENWQAAADDATKAMVGYTPYSITDVSKPNFIDANASNWMWAIIITPANISAPYPSWPAKLSSFTGDGYSTAVGCYKSVNRLLFDKISDTDVRKGWWVDENLESPNLATLTWAGATGNAIAPLNIPDVKLPFIPYTNVKFAQYGGPGGTVNAGDWCIMRVEEMILIKAEAEGMLNEGAGKAILQDFVQSYRDPKYSVDAAGRSFRDEIWFQRRVELWGEGFSMADIMRLNKNIVRFKPSIQTNFPEAYKFNIASNDGWLLLRIPQRETNTNAGIPIELNNNEGSLPVTGQNSNLTDGVTD
ncbi:Starch-binding associating with outer membrane [anaerobic digester metagenome]